MPSIAELRQADPDLQGLDDDQVVDVYHGAYYPDLPREDIAAALGVKPAAPPKPSGTILGNIADTGLSLVKGAIGSVESVVGLGDLVSGGRAGKAAEEAGFRAKEAKTILDEGYSPAHKAGLKEVADAEGLWETIKAGLRNPRVPIQAAVESTPMMLGGGLVARGILKMAPKVGGAMAAALGEGTMMAGGAAEEYRQQTPGGLLIEGQAPLAMATGAAGTLFGFMGGRLAQRLGIADPDTMLAGAAANPKASKSIVRMTLEGAVAEGFLEELPQSVVEQVNQNLATGKPIDEGVNQAAVLGTMAGSLMGGGANTFKGFKDGRPLWGSDKTTTPPPAAPAPVPTPQDVMDAPTVDSAIHLALKAVDARMERLRDGTASVDEMFPPAPPAPQPPAPPPVPEIPVTAATEQDAALYDQFTQGEPDAAQTDIPGGFGGMLTQGVAPATVRQSPAAGMDAGALPADAPASGVAARGGAVGVEAARPTSVPAGRAAAVQAEAARAGQVGDVQVPQAGAPGDGGLRDGRAADGAVPAAGLTPEDLALRLMRADVAAGTERGKQRAGSKAASPDDAERVRVQVLADIDAARGADPQAWAEYDERQKVLRALPEGAPVLYGDQRGTILKKFVKNWRVELEDGTKTLLPPGALRPAEGATNAQATAPAAAPPAAESPAPTPDAAGPADAAGDGGRGADRPADGRVAGDAEDGAEPALTTEVGADVSRGTDNTKVGRSTGQAPQSENKVASAIDYAAAGADWTRMRDVDRAALLHGIGFHHPPRAWDKMGPVLQAKVAKAMGYQPTYAQRKVANAADIIAWAREQGFQDVEAADKLHVTIAFSRTPMNPLQVGNTSPAYQKGKVTGTAGREVARLGDEGAIVLKFASPVLQTRWQQYRKAGASWDFPEYQPHITISYGDKGLDLSTVKPYTGPIELGPEIVEPLKPREEKTDEDEGAPDAATGAATAADVGVERQQDDAVDSAGRAGLQPPAARDEGASAAGQPARDADPEAAAGDLTQPRDPESGQFVEAEQTSTRRFTLSSGNKVKITESAQDGLFMVMVSDGGANQWSSWGTFRIDANGFATGHKARANWAMRDVREAAALFAVNHKGGPKATPQVPNEPGTKYVLPSFVTGGGKRETSGNDGPASPADSKTVAPSANKLVTDDAAAAARARLKSKLGRLGSGVDPEMMIDGVVLAAYHIEKGARTFAAYARAMLDDLGEAARPFLKSWYMGVKYDPRYSGELGAGMSSAGFVDEFDMAAIAAPKAETQDVPADARARALEAGRKFAADIFDWNGKTSTRAKVEAAIMLHLLDKEGVSGPSAEAAAKELTAQLAMPSDSKPAATADTGDEDGTAARTVDRPREGEPAGQPAAGVRAPAGSWDAGGAAAGDGRRDGRGAAQPADGERGVSGRMGAGASAPVPGAGARERAAPADDGGVQGAPRDDAGAGGPSDAGRAGGLSTDNPAPNAPPVAAPQFKPEDFTIAEDFALGEGGQKTKFRNNVEAIRLLQKLEDEQRFATPDEQQVLAKYVGWGGLPQAFDAANSDWRREFAELKELLSEADYEAARRSTRYAHYTSREIIQDGIYAALHRFGFPGGRVLESGAGVGNFIGLMPQDMRSAGRFTAIEREPIAGGIAKQLYPLQNIQLADFTEFKGADGYYDAVVGNPPFAADAQVDASGRKHLSGLSLHNYFFAKAVDMLREGGILAQVTTSSFLDANGDKARKYISDRTKFLGAIRLPNNAFAKNAGTEVTTDIIFLQKRPESEWGSRAARAEAKAWMEVRNYTDRNGTTVPLNQYFIDHPEMMLGDFGAFGTMYRRGTTALIVRDGQDTAALLKEAIAKLPEGIYKSIAETGTDDAIGAAVEALKNPPVQEGGYFVEGGKVMQRLPDVAGEARGVEITPNSMWTEKTRLGENGFDKLKRLAQMRQTVRDLLAAEMDNDKAMDGLRARLNEQYDAFVKEHGLINDRATWRVFDDDPDFPLLLSLEHDYTPGLGPAEAKKLGVPRTKSSAKKGAIFTRRVVDAREQVKKVETPEDALNVSMAERGRLDMAYISQLLGKDADETLAALTEGDKPLLFLDPATDEYALRDAYLSGNVRAKLAQAKAAGMAGNVAALEKVQPEDVPAHEIGAKIGAPWVPTAVYEDFAKDLFGEGTAASISYMKLNSSYSVHVKPGSEVNNSNKWGIPKYTGTELLAALLNNRTIKVTDKDSDGKVYVLQEETDNANTKAQEIRDRFSDWLFADPDRSEMLVRAYNDTNNNYVTRSYDGSWMTFPGKVPNSIITFRRHQRNAIARIVQDRTALLDHVVGAGKTFTVIAAAMEMRRTGLAKKNVVTVPNHLVKQWAADFYRLYPGAKILTATKKDFAKVNRRRFLAKIATGDWDAVVIAHSSFGFIRPGKEFEAEFNARQVGLIKAAIVDVNESDANPSQRKRTVKQLEGMIERLGNRIKKLRDKEMDDLLDFDELGVDQLFVDEAHLFKNLMYTTKLQGVAGLGDPAGAKRAYDMYVKTQEVMEKNGRGQGVVFATGTPVSNSLAEKYHMMRYLMPRQMEELGFQSFDAWANTYAEVTQVWMQKPSGDGFKAQNRMSTFSNVHELLKLFDQVADTVTNDDIKKAYKEDHDGKEYPLPPVKTGRRIPVSLEKSPAQAAYMTQLAARAKALEASKGPPKKGEDNILVLMTDARKAAMDIRLVDIDRTEREKGGRIDKAADNILERYQRFNASKGTQLVFSDLGTPKKHAEKELKEYMALQGMIAEATPEMQDRAALGDERAQEIVDAAEDAERQLDEKGPDWLTAVKAALRGFSVYDDLKDALIERGIPENEIAFIHDYDGDEQKAALFRKVNSGQIRVLMGSTAKMGAGTNVQQRLVALHHLDVPWRPSDVEQREGRIERQGNLLYENAEDPSTVIPGFEVEILAYVTRDTLDMRMWQIQEVKLKVIHQLRTRQIERNMDNAFETAEMSASEMQAAATGNMDLLHEIQARNDIKTLERKRRSFDAQKNDLIARRRRAQRDLTELPPRIAEAKRLQGLGAQFRQEAGAARGQFKATIDGEEFTDKQAASAKLLSLVDAKLYSRTVEKDGKKVREELTPQDHAALREKHDALLREGKNAEASDVNDELSTWKERAAPLDVNFNGEVYTSRDRLTEAWRNAVGDNDGFYFQDPAGKGHIRRATGAAAVRQLVTDAIADEKEVMLGKFGPFTLTAEGQPASGKKGERGRALELTLREGDKVVAESYIEYSEEQAKETLKIAESALDWADRRASNIGNDVNWLEADLSRAEKMKKELDDTEDLTEWPDQDKLEAARKRHQEILARLSGKGVAPPDPDDDGPGGGASPELFAPDAAGSGAASDLAVYNAARNGDGARAILQRIADTSTTPFYRELAEALLKLGISPKVSTDLSGRRRVGQSDKFAAGKYSPTQDTVYLWTPRWAERVMLHEMTHAATTRAIAAKTPAALRLQVLYDHVKRNGGAVGQYGMTNLDEFVAEAFTNSSFQMLLQGMPAAPTSRLKSAWDWLVSVVRHVLGLPQSTITALDEVLRAGAQVMQENAGAATPEEAGMLAAEGGDLFAEDAPLNDPRAFRPQARKVFDELMNSPGKLNWWHKTLGTPYNLAQRSKPFKRVFDRVQDFLGDVSKYATEAADKAPTILPKLETWRDILPNWVPGSSGKRPVSAAENKAILQPIIQGTLSYTRDKFGNPIKIDEMEEQAKMLTADEKAEQMVRTDLLATNVLAMWKGLPYEQFTANVETRYANTVLKPGIRWTDTELRRIFNLGDQEVKLYREYRAGIDESVTRLALAAMIRTVGADADFIRDEVMEAKDIGEGAALLIDQLRELQRTEPDRAGELAKTVDLVEDAARKGIGLLDKGYAPLMRFGNYTVTVYGPDENGEEEVKFFGMYEGPFEAARERERLAEVFGREATRIERGTMNDEAYKLFQGVSPETAELFGEMLGLNATGDTEADQAFQAWLKLAKNSRSAMKRLIHRKGTAGFNEDMPRVLAAFIYSNARMTSRYLHQGEIAQAVRDVPQREGETGKMATRLMEYVNNPTEEAAQLRGLLFAQYLGGSAAAMLVNMTQPLAVTSPWLTQFGGISQAKKSMGFALSKAWADTTGDAALDKALQRGIEEGIVAPQEVHQLMAQAQGRATLKAGDGTVRGNARAALNNFGNRLFMAWGKPFATAELFNRRVTFVAAYRTAQDQGIANPYEFAKRAIAETQFVYNKGNRPEWARGALGAVVMTFKQYSISYMEMVSRMWNAGEPGSPERAAGRRAVFYAAGMLLFFGGLGGLPFAEDVEDVIDGVLQRLGYNWSTKQKKRELLEAAFGKAFGSALEKGISGLPGVPIDVARRLGMGNLIPGSGLVQVKKDYTQDALEIAGPAASYFQSLARGLNMASRGEVMKGTVQAMPVAAQNLGKMFEMLATGEYRDRANNKVIDVTTGDAIAKGLGFQPSAVAEASEGDRQAQLMAERARIRESEIAAKWARGIADRDPAMQQEARRELADWNEKNEATPIKIRLADVLRRASKMRQTRAQRIEAAAPKEVRAEARRIMQRE